MLKCILGDRMLELNHNIFREYDIRGIYPTDIDSDVARIVGKSYGSYIQKKLGKKICVVGHDNRLSSPILSESLIEGITSTGCDVIDCGLCTTPMYYYACIYTKAIIGIMITASHNPKDDNGFKFSFDEFGNARGQDVYDFRDFTLEGDFLTGKGKVIPIDITPYYIEAIKNSIHMGPRKLKVVLDPGNGTTAIIAKKIHELFPIDYEIICGESDGNFPLHHPDPSVEDNLSMLKQKVLETHADVGLAYDGDGDRLGIIDNTGTFISMDQFMILMIRYLAPKLENKRFLYDVKCSKLLEDEIKRLGGIPICYRTGNSYTRSKVNQDNIPFGGELSGHIYFRDKWNGIDSGIYAGLRLLEVLSHTEESISTLLSGLPKVYNTPEIKVPTSDEIKFDIVEKVKDYCIQKNYTILTIDGVRITFPDGWALVRASNTGPNLTLRFEAITQERLEEIKKEFTELVNSF